MADLTTVNQPLLLTKLIPPAPGHGLIIRDRIISKLNEALSYPVVLVTAPTGYGKTSCLSVFASSISTQTAWISLEEADNDPVRFWSYFIAAITRIMPDLHLDIPIIIPGLGMNTLTNGLDELCNCLTNASVPIIFILDDFQLVTHSDILRSIAYLIDHIPPNFHLIISTRETPLLPLTRLRAKNRLVEIRPFELNFSIYEVESFFQNSGNSLLNQEQCKQILDLTHGWAAGIRLMEIALRNNLNRLDAWKEGKKLAVDYLTSEIIEQLPVEWVSVLKKISVFDQFTNEAAIFIAEMEESVNLLDQITQANLFLDHEGDTFQFHPFFREALKQKWTDEECRLFNHRAAVWFEAHSMPEKAILHALAGESWETAIRLIFLHAETRFQMGEIQTLEHWLLLIPDDVRVANPDLLVLLGWVWYLLGKIPEAQQIMQALEHEEMSGRISNDESWAGLRCQIALVHEENTLALEYARIALNETSIMGGFLRGILLSSLASAQQALGDSEGAVISFKQSIDLNHKSGNLLMALFSLVSLGIELNEQGKRQEVLVLCHDVIDDLAGQPEEANPVTGIIDILLARLFWESNQLDEAQKALEHSTVKLDLLGIPGFQISGDLIRSMILTAREQYNDALNLINKNRRRTRSGEFIGFRHIFDMLRAEIDLKMGNLANVKAWLEGAGLPASPLDDPAREHEFVLKARYLLEIGSTHEAGQVLNELENHARNVHHVRILIASLLIKATLEWKKGELGLVKTFLEEALAQAAPQQYIRVLLENGGPLLGLVAQMPGAPAEIRARFPVANPSDYPGLIAMLTSREMEVLRLLAENKTNLEIAQQLVLSGETVKVHLKHIFQKLEVSDRRQAVRRAHELELR